MGLQFKRSVPASEDPDPVAESDDHEDRDDSDGSVEDEECPSLDEIIEVYAQD